MFDIVAVMHLDWIGKDATQQGRALQTSLTLGCRNTLVHHNYIGYIRLEAPIHSELSSKSSHTGVLLFVQAG